MNKAKQVYLILRELGTRYVLYRLWYEFKRKSGILKISFPLACKSQNNLSLEEWRRKENHHFMLERERIEIPRVQSVALEGRFKRLKAGEFLFFNHQWIKLGQQYDWLTNPDTSYTYPLQHWTTIPSYSKERGDIKYVWEKSRFCYFLDILRYDYHFKEDNAAFVFSEITDWIEKNPLNRGPNYVCSQETSLRLLNWTTALSFYKNAEALTNDVFQKILNAIYGQTKHVEKNLNFSRYLVRNNHAITECFLLFFIGVIFSNFKESKRWVEKGQRLLDKEILYQFYTDGSYIQYSHNYHRVAIQIATWYLVIAQKNKIAVKPAVVNRLTESSGFLRAHMQPNGWLPNYGANDGALFFKWNDDDYRNFGSQLNAFDAALNRPIDTHFGTEEIQWYGLNTTSVLTSKPKTIERFDETGFYVLRHQDLTVYIRCGNHKNRPSQADNLHIDVWYKGENVLWDTGSYKYNTSTKNIRFFWGTKGHNTVQLGQYDQMQKGSNFLWHYWSQTDSEVELQENEENITFTGAISAFRILNKHLKHQRKVVVSQHQILVEDTITGGPKGIEIVQNWHLNPAMAKHVKLESECKQKRSASFCSNYYGVKDASELIEIAATDSTIQTKILFL